MLLLHRLLEQSKALDKQGCVGVWDQLASYPNLTCSFSMLSESPPVLSFLAAVALATLASAMQVLLICCFFGLSTVLPHANECSTPNTKAAGRRVMNSCTSSERSEGMTGPSWHPPTFSAQGSQLTSELVWRRYPWPRHTFFNSYRDHCHPPKRNAYSIFFCARLKLVKDVKPVKFEEAHARLFVSQASVVRW